MGRRFHFGEGSGYGRKGGAGPNTGKKAVTYTCTSPTGEVHRKRVFLPLFENPVALYYQHNGVWYLNTVVDRNNMPVWASNYTFGTAEYIFPYP